MTPLAPPMPLPPHHPQAGEPERVIRMNRSEFADFFHWRGGLGHEWKAKLRYAEAIQRKAVEQAGYRTD